MVNKLFSLCKKLYRRKHEKQKSTNLEMNRVLNLLIKQECTIGIINYIKQWSNLNKENNMPPQTLPPTVTTNVGEDKIQLSSTADFEQQFKDAILALNGGLSRLHSLNNQIQSFVDNVEEKLQNPGN